MEGAGEDRQEGRGLGWPAGRAVAGGACSIQWRLSKNAGDLSRCNAYGMSVATGDVASAVDTGHGFP